MESSNKRTNQVLEKWGIDNDVDNLKEEDLQKAAEMYAKIMVRNRSLKRFAFGGIFFVVVFLGLMLASVIIGAEVSKEFKVKDEALVQKSGNVLQTSEMYYSLNLNLTTPLSVIKGIKSLKFINKQDGSIIQFNVVSFYYIRGRKLTFYGQTHMANVLSSGEVEFFPISKVNGEKRIDETKMKRGDADDLSAMTTEALYGYGITPISDCNGLSNIGSTGKYSLLNNINCNLSAPLLTSGFFGTFNGHGNTITLNMNVNGPAALFSKVGEGAVIANLFINGNIVGKGNCSAFAVEAFKNSLFLGCAVYANVTCSNVNEDLDDFTALGGFAAVLRNPPGTGTGRISFYYSVNQGNFVITSSTSNKTTYTGGSYGRTGWGEVVQTSFNFTYSASLLSKLSSSYRVNRFGFKFSFPSNTTVTNSSRFDDLRAVAKRDDPYIPEDCYNYTGLDFINMCIAWYVIYWYENYDCCSDFNSCPYVMCDHYSDVCYYCQHKKVDSSPEQAHNGIGDLIVPTIKNVCGYFSN